MWGDIWRRLRHLLHSDDNMLAHFRRDGSIDWECSMCGHIVKGLRYQEEK